MKGRIALPLLVPRRGLIANLPSHEVPPDAVVDGKNMVMDTGGLYTLRPGYTLFATATDAGRIMGGVDYKDVSGNQRTIIGTRTHLYKINTGIPADLTGPTIPTGGTDAHWRFVVFREGTISKVIATNNTNKIQVYNEESGGTFADLTNAPASARALLILANRLVALNITDTGLKPTRVRWTAVNASTNWPALAVADLADADDHIIVGVNINRLSAIIYRERSQWMMTAQTGTDATAFRFEHLNDSPGPLSAACVIPFGKLHYYLARDLRVYRFDGHNAVTVSDPLGSVAYTVLSPSGVTLTRAHGNVFWPLRLLWWVLPDSSGALNTCVAFSPDRSAWEAQQVFNDSISASFVVAASSPVGFLRLYICGIDGKVYELDEADTSDNGTAISFSWNTPKRSEDTRATYQVDEMEDYFTQVTTSDEVTVKVHGWSQPNALESTLIIDSSHNLNAGPRFQLSPPKDMKLNVYGRFLQAAYSGSTTRRITWSGGFLYVNEKLD